MGALPKILTIGGDHSIAIGSVSAISNLMLEALNYQVPVRFSQPDLVVFWIDAHADINTPSTTLSGNLHGCPVSLLAGLDKQSWDELPEFEWTRKRLEDMHTQRESFIKSSKIVYIGLRDVDIAEQKMINELGIVSYPMSALKACGCPIRAAVQQALAQVDPQGIHPIHISFDIDAIDPNFAPSTGTPVADGLLPEEGAEIIQLLGKTGRLVSMDLVEVNTRLGSEEDVRTTLATAHHLIETFESS